MIKKKTTQTEILKIWSLQRRLSIVWDAVIVFHPTAINCRCAILSATCKVNKIPCWRCLMFFYCTIIICKVLANELWPSGKNANQERKSLSRLYTWGFALVWYRRQTTRFIAFKFFSTETSHLVLDKLKDGNHLWWPSWLSV